MYMQFRDADALLGRLVYTLDDSVIRNLSDFVDVVKKNGNSKSYVMFSHFKLALGFHGATHA
jgi:hypothetical protein